MNFQVPLFCQECPTNTTTNWIIGANSHQQCLCKERYYENENTQEVSGAYQKCKICPQGAICPGTFWGIQMMLPIVFWQLLLDCICF